VLHLPDDPEHARAERGERFHFEKGDSFGGANPALFISQEAKKKKGRLIKQSEQK
jgi:hypothetical protein